MRRLLSLGLACFTVLFALSGQTQAGLMISGLPSSFTPGDDFEFVVTLDEDVTGLIGFGVTLSMESTSGSPGTDFAFSAVRPDDADYVFGPLGIDFRANPITDPTNAFLNVSDFDFPAVDVTAPKQLAVVTVATTPSAGDLNIDFDFNSLSTLSGEVELPTSGGGPVTAIPGSAPIPEPSSLAIFALGSIVMAGVGVRRRRQKA
jgi:hypothetical protein